MNRTKSLVPIVLLFIIFSGEGYAQWERANLPDSVRVNTIEMSDSMILAGTDGDGIFVSTDDGGNWASSNNGLQGTCIHSILILGNSIFAGTETGVSVSTDNGVSWKSTSTGLSGLGVWSLAASRDAAGDTTIFAGSWNGVYSSTDQGEHWEATRLSNTTSPVHSLAVSGDTIWAATFSEGIFLSRDNGSTWIYHDVNPKGTTDYFPIPVSSPICSISLFAGLGEKDIVVGSIGYLYRSYYGDTLFVPDTSLAKLTNKAAPIFCFANRNDTLFAAVGGNLYKLFWVRTYIYDPGIPGIRPPRIIDSVVALDARWSKIPSLGDRTVYSLALNNAYIFAGTEDGIWRLRYPGVITRVERSDAVPPGFVLKQNYPNPINPSTVIGYQVPAKSAVVLKVVDLLGREMATLVDQVQQAGTYGVRFDGSNLPSGVYFCRLQAGPYGATKKLLLLK